MELEFGGRLGQPWAKRDDLSNVRKFYLLACEKRHVLCLWDPHGRLSEVLNEQMSLSERRAAMDASSSIDDLKFIFTSVSSAADLIHCKSSNGNELFTVPEKNNQKLKNVKSDLVATESMSIGSALEDMPKLKLLVGDVETSGWGKRLNTETMFLIAKTFFNVPSPVIARIGRTKEDGEVKTPKEPKVKKVKEEQKKAPKGAEGTKKKKETTRQKKRSRRDVEVETLPDKRQRAEPSRQYDEKELRSWLVKSCAYANWACRKEKYLTKLNHPRMQAIQKFGKLMSVDDYDKKDWQVQEAKALLESGLATTPEPKFYFPEPQKDHDVPMASGVLAEFEKVWSDLKNLPSADQPEWLTTANYQIMKREFANLEGLEGLNGLVGGYV